MDQQRGLTLFEALIGLAITGIVLAAGVPAMASLAERTALGSEEERFFTAIQHARLLAVDTASRVVICPSATQEDCLEDPHWHRGYITFMDDDQDRERDPEETIIHVAAGAEEGFQITSSRYRRRIGFLPTGMSYGSNVTVRFCPPQTGTTQPRGIIISNNGRARQTDLPPTACDSDQ